MDRVRRGRVATSLIFLLFGAALGVWTARIPAVKEGLGLSDGRLSVALLAFAAGCIAGMVLVGRLTDRFGSSRVLIPAALLEGVLLIPPGLSDGLVTLSVALFVFGTVHGTLNIAMNANAAEVERERGRPIMSSFHAIYSIGGFLGAILGSVFAHAGVSVAVTLISVGLTAVMLAAAASAWVLRSSPPPGDEREPVGTELVGTEPGGGGPGGTRRDSAGRGSARPGGRRMLLVFYGIVVVCTLVGEGAAADWSAVHLRDERGTSEGAAAYGYAAFAIMMTLGRFVGDRAAGRFGPVAVIRASGLLAAAGLGAGLVLAHPVAVIAGWGLFGLGLSCVAPQFFTAAAGVDPRRAGQALSTVVSIGYLGFLLGPIAIGAVATVVGLTTALWIPVVLAIFVAASARSIRPSRAA
ncbi:MFS transporter [Actinoplanes derwentensis]|uniref:Predicted arabinose efflux permease, MFS family n=1 Tax=Actinoplanes derwentensis TaxID=113562 RepID=A0A1H1U8L7_9ACTN|nr:MFS transporter [Actinoplanes derwentensis]GID85232.1 MFS transporter [Actinoplanes derwentensis]SDS68804.1 Predicted arabinose efflux permease, MFS family [Actinoplanes derwentensis]